MPNLTLFDISDDNFVNVRENRDFLDRWALSLQIADQSQVFADPRPDSFYSITSVSVLLN